MKRRRDSLSGTRPAYRSIGAKLLAKAASQKIKLSRSLQGRLPQLVQVAKTKEWLAANRMAIDAYNARVKRDGV